MIRVVALLLLVLSICLASERIEPFGQPGGLVVCESPSAEVLERFAKWTGDAEKAKVLLVGDSAVVAKHFPNAVKLAATAKLPEGKFSALWLHSANKDAIDLAKQLLREGGAVGISGKATSVLGEILPDAKIGKSAISGKVAIELGKGALFVKGRSVGVVDEVKIRLAAGGGRKERMIEVGENSKVDWTAFRRNARDRAENFPPAKPAEPIVEKGTLIIIGGGGMPTGMVKRFVELAGGKDAKIVCLPTAMEDPLPKRDGFAEACKAAGAAKVTLLPSRKREQIESKEYLEAVKQATGVWFGGGRQWRFVDAYEGTKMQPLFSEVLKRGGVIAGSSAGATIQGEYLCRGGVFENFAISYEGYERGFAFLPGVGIDQHFAQRNRFNDLSELAGRYPQYLGIGIDEATAIVVQGSIAEVTGKGKVHFFDARKKSEKGKQEYESFGSGEKYDLRMRKSAKVE
jgi:cyanophycinase